MIDILVPVLGRPHNAAPLVQNIHDTTTVEHRVVFLCSRGDLEQFKAVCDSGADGYMLMDYPAGHGDYAKKINHGFAHGTGSEWVFNGADDIRFEQGWDTAALKAAGDRFDVVATNDMANANVRRGQFGTHNLIRRRYVTDGVVLHEGYDHNFVDRELCGFAQQRGVFTFARHSRVRHYHPLWKTALDDATYRKSLARFKEDQALFYSRAHLWDYHGLSAQERKMAA